LIFTICTGKRHIDPDDPEKQEPIEGFDPDNPWSASNDFKPFFSNNESLDSWADERLVHLDPEERERAKAAVNTYIYASQRVAGEYTYNLDAEARAQHLEIEGFAYLASDYTLIEEMASGTESSDKGHIPTFMAGTYRAMLKDEVVERLDMDGAGYFQDERTLTEEFTPLLRDYVEWMKARYPQLQSEK
jgi:hypothetical protein